MSENSPFKTYMEGKEERIVRQSTLGYAINLVGTNGLLQDRVKKVEMLQAYFMEFVMTGAWPELGDEEK